MHRTCCLWLVLFAAACSRAPSASSPAAPTTRINRAPTVKVAFSAASECYPTPVRGAQAGKPCSLAVVAQATDPDGDPLSYAWSGCATGTSAQEVCSVAQPGPVTASVEVRDDHGLTATASAAGTGINHPPPVASLS